MATAAEKKDTVKIMLPPPRDDFDDEFVIVIMDGVTYQINRGEEVEVPIRVKEALDWAEHQNQVVSARTRRGKI